MRRMELGGIDTGWIIFLLIFGADLVAQAILPLFEFGCEIGTEVFGFEDGADFQLGTRAERAALEPLDGLLDVADLPDPEAGDEFFGLGEGAVGDGGFAGGEGDALACGTRLEAFSSEHY